MKENMAGDYTVMSSNVTDHFMQFTSLGKIYSMEFFPVEKGKIMYVMTRQYLKISLVNYSDMLVWDEQKVKIGILGSFQVSFGRPCFGQKSLQTDLALKWLFGTYFSIDFN